MKHLVFYDGECGFCDRSVQMLLRIDTAKIFAFAPLQGSTAAKYLKEERTLLELDTLVLIENYQEAEREIYTYGKAVFRICWLLGGWWKVAGWPCFFPGFLYNWMYRLIARNRMGIFGPPGTCRLPGSANDGRFLP